MRQLVAVLMMLVLAGGVSEAGRRGSGGGRGSSGPRLTGTGSSKSSVSVRGYTKRSGTYVAPAKRTRADSTQRNNYSTKGNTNTYTGKRGSRYAGY